MTGMLGPRSGRNDLTFWVSIPPYPRYWTGETDLLHLMDFDYECWSVIIHCSDKAYEVLEGPHYFQWLYMHS